jgi:hypothetical protein
MTNEQINIAIAKACGWKNLEIEDFSEYGVPCFMLMGSNHTGTRLMPPDYCNDLNAMHEAEKILTTKQKQRYAIALSDDLSDSAPTDSCHTVWSDTIHATAAQRAEAFLRTFGKWEETK